MNKHNEDPPRLRTRAEWEAPMRSELVSYDLPGGHLAALLAEVNADIDPAITGSRRVRAALSFLAQRLRDAAGGLKAMAAEIPKRSPRYIIHDDGSLTMPTERAEHLEGFDEYVWLGRIDR